MHLAKIQEMKSISKPQLPIEIYTFQEIMLNEEFRKSSGILAFRKKPSSGAREGKQKRKIWRTGGPLP